MLNYVKLTACSLFGLFPTLMFAVNTLQVVDNITSPMTLFTKAIYAVCYILGVFFLLSGIVQYKQHRGNPQQIRLSTPIFLVFAGILLLCLPWLLSLSPASGFMR